MKRLLVLVLLVPILALTMISCDADMRSSIAGFMGGFGGNVYSDAGLIVVNTAQAEAAAVTIAAIGTGTAGSENVSGGISASLGIDITVPGGVETMLAPQLPDKQKELKDNLGDAFNSDKQKEKLLEDLKKPVTDADQKKAAQGTVLVLNQALEDLKGSLSGSVELGDALDKLKLPVIANEDTITQGDMLALQLMTDLISNTIASLQTIGGGTLGGVDEEALESSANQNTLLSIIDDALFVAEMAENLSGAASIDFTGQIDLGSLLDGLGNKGAKSRGEELALTDAEDFLGTINALAPSIVGLMGVTYDGTDFIYTAAKYKSFLLNQQIYRSAMEQALKMIKLGKLAKKDIDSLTFDTSTLVKYALAVLLTEHDAFWKAEFVRLDSPSSSVLKPVNETIAKYLNANKKLGLGKLTKYDSLTVPDNTVTGLDYALWPAFLASKSLTYYEAIVGNLLRINDLGGIALLSDQIKKDFYDPADSSVTGLSDWYVDLSVEV